MKFQLALAFMVIATAFAGCSSSSNDADRDSLLDQTERDGYDITVDLLRERVTRHVTSDPAVGDTDHDGINDANEFVLRLDPRNPDTDLDGLTDCQELINRSLQVCEQPGGPSGSDGGYGTDPLKADSDHRGGRYVRAAGWFSDKTGTLDPKDLNWGDGLPDGAEVEGTTYKLMSGTRTIKTNPLAVDSDNDRLEDGEEGLYRSDPTVADTDGDGCMDGSDPWPDVTETYGLGLLNFTLPPDSARAVELVLTVQYAGAVARIPAQGSIHVGPGQTVDLHGVSPEPRPLAGCSIPPYAPFTRLSIIANDDATGRQLGLAVSGNFTEALFWDVRSGSFTSNQALAGAPGPVVLSGVDGRLVLAPFLQKGNGQAS